MFGLSRSTTAIDSGDDSFDAVVAGEFIEHLSYADGLQTLAEFKRILRPGGQLLMTTPYPDYLRLVKVRARYAGRRMFRALSQALKVMMKRAGFTCVEWRPAGA
ncbi:MAG: methyltransferase domain-containing protein [Sphingomonadaceae bacterium]